MLRQLITAAIAGCVVVSLTGCLITSSSRVQESGVRISSPTMSQIVPGETTEEWLLTTLGEPNARTRIEGTDNAEILRYDHSVTQKSHGSLFLIFHGGSSKTNSSKAYFQVSNGVVTRAWREGSA